MGGSSGDSSQISYTRYNPTKYNNPYSSVTTNSKRTTAGFKDGTLYSNIYDYGNQNVNDLLNEWRNPSLDTATNRAKIDQYQRNMNEGALNSLENNIIAPLSQRNMINSSQATMLYDSLNKNLTKNYNDFLTNLLSESQNNSGNMINQLINWYTQGQNVLNQAEQNAINQASGNATTIGGGTTSAS